MLLILSFFFCVRVSLSLCVCQSLLVSVVLHCIEVRLTKTKGSLVSIESDVSVYVCLSVYVFVYVPLYLNLFVKVFVFAVYQLLRFKAFDVVKDIDNEKQ